MMAYGQRILMVVAAAVLIAACEKEDPAKAPRMAAEKAFKAGEFAEAARLWEESLALNPAQPQLHEKRAIAYIKLKDFDAADAAYMKSVEGKSAEEIAAAHGRLAAGYLKTGPVEKADFHFKKVLETNPKDETTLMWLGEIWSTLGGARKGDAPAIASNLETAIGYYDQVIANNPEHLFAHVNRRIALVKLSNDVAKAQDTALKAAAVFKRGEHYKEEMAKAQAAQARLEAIKADFEREGAIIKELQAKAKALAAAADGGTPTTATATTTPP